MKPRTASRLAWLLWDLVVVLLGGSLVLGFLGDIPVGEWVFVVLFPAFLIASATVGALIASRQPGNTIGWIFLATALFWSISQGAHEVVRYVDRSAVPISAWVRFLDWFGAWLFLPGIFLPATFVFLLFPDGRLPSRRWRPVAWMSGIGIVGIVLQTAFTPGPLEDAVILRSNPYAIGGPGLWNVVSFTGWLGFVGMLGSATALGVRLRRSSGATRQQLKWLAYAGAIVVVAFTLASIIWSVVENQTGTIIGQALMLLALLLVPVAAGIAILRHRLYEIDLVIRKTVVFAILATILTGVFVFLAASFGAVVGIVADPSGAPLAIGSAFAVGLLTVPLWRISRRIADRVVFGGRQTPYEVLAAFSQGVSDAYSTDDVLPRMAEVLGAATGATRAVVWMRLVDQLRPVGTWPLDRRPAPIRTGGSASPAFPEDDHAFWIRHQGEDLGALSVTLPASDPMNASKEQLIEDLARQAGPVVRNVRLIEELRGSRQRLVAAQDEERRRLERNIHDGAQQQMVALSVKMRLLKTLARKDPGKAEELVDQLQADARDALDDLRDLARGIYPPLLADQGLVSALEAQARKAAIPVEVDSDGVGRYPQEAEATAYFCVLEALQNVAKYAEASRVLVRLGEEDGHLLFSVADNGRGFDVASTPKGAGLQNMSDRVEAIGGTIEVSSAPGEGTTVAGWVPVSA